MSHQQKEVPDLEALGEWDHGMLDPVFQHSPTNPFQPQPNVSFQDLKRRVLKVENEMEDAVRKTFHKVEHAVEKMIHEADEVQAFEDELAGIVDVGVALVPMDGHREG